MGRTVAILPRLGINIDHVATLRQLRGTPYPDLLESARAAIAGGADQITIHLREDRRHIQDADVKLLSRELTVPLNFEMAVTDEMVRIASRIKPAWVCLVPEKRQELTTEGGLAVEKGARRIGAAISKLRKADIKVSLFVEPSVKAVELSARLEADAVELHTGRYCLAMQRDLHRSNRPAKIEARGTLGRSKSELIRIVKSANRALELGIGAHAGHGFDYDNVRPVAELNSPEGRPLIHEYNIGHAVVCRAVFVGMERAVKEMKSAILAP